jgi:hypothetical protein
MGLLQQARYALSVGAAAGPPKRPSSPRCCSSSRRSVSACGCALRLLRCDGRRRSKHVIAKNSMRLINCPPAEIETRLRQALGEIGAAIGAQRAYVALADNPTRVHAWSAEKATYPPGWPERALELSARFGAAGSAIPNIAALQPGELRDALAAAGVRSWTCAPLVRPGRARGSIGFDAFGPARDGIFGQPVAGLAGGRRRQRHRAGVS